MANESNLKPVRTKKEARERGRNGGLKSAEVRQERKTMKAQMEMLLTLPLKDDNVKAKFKRLGIDTDDMNNQMALIVATYQKALKGDTSAINIVRELMGEKVQEIKVSGIDDKVKELHVILDQLKDE